ncbi:unnamed protein product, partial [Didymodactylos carnosus]
SWLPAFVHTIKSYRIRGKHISDTGPLTKQELLEARTVENIDVFEAIQSDEATASEHNVQSVSAGGAETSMLSNVEE